MVKLLLAHFANPHALTANQLLPRDLARDPQIIKDLENAEETFLDLEEQKTPVKTKRFSASLLDETDDETNEFINVQTRTIYRRRSCKKDLKIEKEILMKIRDQLRKEVFRRSRTLSYSSPTPSPLKSGQRFFDDDVRPPPLPPRDHPIAITKSLKRIQPISSLKRTVKSTSYDVITCDVFCCKITH